MLKGRDGRRWPSWGAWQGRDAPRNFCEAGEGGHKGARQCRTRLTQWCVNINNKQLILSWIMARSVQAVSAVHSRAHHRPPAQSRGGASRPLTTGTPFLPGGLALHGAASKLTSGGKIHLLPRSWTAWPHDCGLSKLRVRDMTIWNVQMVSSCVP